MNQCFGKEYKLCSKKAIDELFQNKKSVKQFPFILNYSKTEMDFPKSFQIVISAPKRIFRKAHDRNRIKRLMKEVFRKKKLILEEFLESNGIKISLFMVYTNKEELEYLVLEKKMEQLLIKLRDELKTII
jgi:ribonuclease P protein component